MSERNGGFRPKGMDVSTPKLPSGYYSSCVNSFPKLKVGEGELPRQEAAQMAVLPGRGDRLHVALGWQRCARVDNSLEISISRPVTATIVAFFFLFFFFSSTRKRILNGSHVTKLPLKSRSFAGEKASADAIHFKDILNQAL